MHSLNLKNPKMFKVIFIAFIFFKSVSCTQELFDKFNQKDYKLKNFRIELPYYDKDFCNEFSIKTFKFNRTTPAVNISFNFKFDVQDKPEFLIQAYKKASNEYRRFPIRLLLNMAEMFESNVAGMQSITKCGNIKKIYFLKDTSYYFCNFVIDENKFPPLIPTGEFALNNHIMYYNREIALAKVFIEVYRPILPPKE